MLQKEQVVFSILADILSGPLDFVVSREASISRIFSSLQRKSSGKLSRHCMQWKSSDNGVCELLKHDAKNVFRSSAFSSLVCATLVPLCRLGMEADEQLSILQAFQNSFGLCGLILKIPFESLFEHGSDFVPISLVF